MIRDEITKAEYSRLPLVKTVQNEGYCPALGCSGSTLSALKSTKRVAGGGAGTLVSVYTCWYCGKPVRA